MSDLATHSAIKALSKEDISLLVRHPDVSIRAMAAQRICRKVRDIKLSEVERVFAHKVLTLIADDVAAMVRRALAVTLKNSPQLPRDLAQKLADDIESIAVPVLAHSPVFTDQDLLEVLKSKAAAKIAAVARRPSVSDHVAKAIIRFGDSRAVAELAANDGAMISEDTANEILNIYKDNDLIKESFILRQDLPLRVTEKLITLVSEDAAYQIQKRHAVSTELAIDLATRARERATVDLVDHSWLTKDMAYFTARLQDEGRLTPSLILRAAGLGQMRFVEYGLARLSGVSPAKSALMVHDGGPFGLKALCQRAKLSDVYFRFIRAACAIFRDLENSGIDYDRDYFQTLMLERLLTVPLDLPEDEQTYFLERLDGLAAQT